ETRRLLSGVGATSCLWHAHHSEPVTSSIDFIKVIKLSGKHQCFPDSVNLPQKSKRTKTAHPCQPRAVPSAPEPSTSPKPSITPVPSTPELSSAQVASVISRSSSTTDPA
ncbi:hypothetical protein ILYODFUR_009278, partial [Ilyodon furcidens]